MSTYQSLVIPLISAKNDVIRSRKFYQVYIFEKFRQFDQASFHKKGYSNNSNLILPN